MKNFFVLFVVSLLAFYVGVGHSYAQSGGKVIGELTITVNGRSSTVNVVQNPKFIHYENLITTTSYDSPCNFFLGASAIEKKNEVSVVFLMSTEDGKNKSSVSKKISLKKDERKGFRLEPKLTCSSDKYLSVTLNY